MSDLYTEVLVKKQQTGKDKAIKGVLIFFTVLFAAAGIMMNPLILLLALVLGIVDYIFIPKLSVEFEYLYVNGDLYIDRIYSQSRRKRAASYELSNMEILAPYQSHQLDSYKNNQSIKRYNYSSGIEGQGHKPYAFVISKDNTMQMVIFEPDEVMLKDIRNRAHVVERAAGAAREGQRHNSGRAGRNELSGELHVHPLPSSLGYFNIVHLSTNARDVRVRRSTHIIRIPQNYITRLVTVIHVSLIRCLSRTVITRPALNPQ